MAQRSIPPKTKLKVLRLYMDGRSMDEIGNILGISKTSVYNFISEKGKSDHRIYLFHTLTITLGKNGLDVDSYSSLIRAANILKRNGIDKEFAVEVVQELMVACFKLNLRPYQLAFFLNKFNDFVIKSNLRSPKEVCEFLKSGMQAWMYQQNELLQVKEQISTLKREEWTRKEKLAKSDPSIAEMEEDLSAAYKENERLRYELELRSIKEIESVPTHPDSLWKLNEKYGIDVTKDEVFLLALDLVKYPHKYPSIFLKKE